MYNPDITSALKNSGQMTSPGTQLPQRRNPYSQIQQDNSSFSDGWSLGGGDKAMDTMSGYFSKQPETQQPVADAGQFKLGEMLGGAEKISGALPMLSGFGGPEKMLSASPVGVMGGPEKMFNASPIAAILRSFGGGK